MDSSAVLWVNRSSEAPLRDGTAKTIVWSVLERSIFGTIHFWWAFFGQDQSCAKNFVAIFVQKIFYIWAFLSIRGTSTYWIDKHVQMIFLHMAIFGHMRYQYLLYRQKCTPGLCSLTPTSLQSYPNSNEPMVPFCGPFNPNSNEPVVPFCGPLTPTLMNQWRSAVLPVVLVLWYRCRSAVHLTPTLMNQWCRSAVH